MLLESIVRSSDDAIITKTLSGIVTSWNPAAERIFGWTSDQMLHRSVMRLIPLRLHQEEMEIARRLHEGERIDNYETRRVTSDGSEIAVSLTISPLRNESGDVVGAIKIVRNITERRNAELARLHLAAIVESSADAILSKDLNGIITSWNASAERLFGYRAAEIVGRSILTLIPEELQDEEPQIIARLLAGERIEHFETTRVRKNGERLAVSLTISPIRDSNGHVIGASKILRDISARKLLEQSLIEAERLATATKTANEMAHALNNPLESLSNLLFLARDRRATPESVRALLELAEGEAGRIAVLASQSIRCSRQNAAVAEHSLEHLSETLRKALG